MTVQKILRLLHERWQEKCGYREVLKLAFPLILSSGALSIQHFVDRMFLTWYSPEAIAAVSPAGMLNFTIMSLFIGTAVYVNTFVAQYFGARQYDRIGRALWQGIYVAIIGGVVHLIIIPFAGRIFSIIGHDDLVQRYEVVYFQILCLGAAPVIAASALSGFFSGRGDTLPVMWVNILATAVNLCMDYILIFGKFRFPEMGVAGAAIATVISSCFSFCIFLMLISRRKYRERYHTLKDWKFERVLFKRLMRFGFPNGAQFCLEITGYTVFILLIGRQGIHYLAATNIAFNINSLAFMPMLGLGMAISILVGQYLGEGRIDMAERSVWSGFHMTFSYMAIVAALYVLIPNILLAPYAVFAEKESFGIIRDITVVLLRFVAFYSLFDALNIVFSYAIKGAGDTRYIMMVIIIDSLFVLIIPCYMAFVVFHAHIYVGWVFASAFIVIMGLAFLFRFKGGKWKSMRVIENIPPSVPSMFPETPVIELDA